MYDLLAFGEWVGFAVRWLHVVAAMAWIGASFYFIALDLMLKPAPDMPKGAYGRSMAAASITPPNIWWRPSGCRSI